MKKNIFLLLCLSFLSSCESTKGPLQTVRIDTPGVLGAACAVQSPLGTQMIISPGTVQVPQSNSKLYITCSQGEHFRGQLDVLPTQSSEKAGYIYPTIISIPIGLHAPSLQPQYRVIGDE